MHQQPNTTRTNVGGRAVSLAALAALLVVLASADAAMRAPTQGLREATDLLASSRSGSVGFGRLVEGLLACAAVPDQGFDAPPIEPAAFVSEPAQVPEALPTTFGLRLLTDLPPPSPA